MLIEVSIGEVIDKITILEIKKEKIKNAKKLRYVIKELVTLNAALKKECKKRAIPFPFEGEVLELKEELKDINLQLWNAEDILREKESKQLYDEEFIQNAVLDSELNDKRFLSKNKINLFFFSKIKEQKSYKHIKYEID